MVDKNIKPAVIPAAPWVQYKFGEMISLKCDEREEEYGPTNFKQKGKVLYVTKKFKYSNIQQLIESEDKCRDIDQDNCELLEDEEEGVISVDISSEEDGNEPIEDGDTQVDLREHFKRFLI